MPRLIAFALAFLGAAGGQAASGASAAGPPSVADPRGRPAPLVHEGPLPESWSARERAVAKGMLGRWRDAWNQAYLVDRVNGTIVFFDLAYSCGMSARLAPSSLSFFQGVVDGRRMRFSFRSSAASPGGGMLVERLEGEGLQMQWVALPILALVHAPEYLGYRSWSPNLSENDRASAERLLGTWKASASSLLASWMPFLSDSSTRLVTFDITHTGHLQVRLGSSRPVVLHPVGVVFEGRFGDAFQRTLTRFTLADGGRRFLGEWETLSVADPAWRVVFQLHPVPAGGTAGGGDTDLPEDHGARPGLAVDDGLAVGDEEDLDLDEDRVELGEAQAEWDDAIQAGGMDGSCSQARMALAAIAGLAIGIAAWGLAITWWRRSSRSVRNGHASGVELEQVAAAPAEASASSAT